MKYELDEAKESYWNQLIKGQTYIVPSRATLGAKKTALCFRYKLFYLNY